MTCPIDLQQADRPRALAATAAGGAVYPVFDDPDGYLRLRAGRPGLRDAKRYFERRAIRRCLADAGRPGVICDAPCGPGRLFDLWRDGGATVLAADLSKDMVAAAMTALRRLGLAGQVRRGDAFNLAGLFGECSADVVACVRFCYYFDADRRVRLLRALARAARGHVLVQYKTRQTPRGLWNWLRGRLRRGRTRKHHCTAAEIRDDARRAGLQLRRIQPIGPASDRVFVLLAK